MLPVSIRANLTGSDRFKIGLFSFNASGGIAMTKVPERWQARWDDIARVAQLADRAGLDFLLPLQRWRGSGAASLTHALRASRAASAAARRALSRLQPSRAPRTSRRISASPLASGGAQVGQPPGRCPMSVATASERPAP